MSVVDIRDRSIRSLEGIASGTAWRDILATAVVALTVLCAMGGLIVFVPGLQLAALAGACAAVIASSTVRAAVTSSVGFALAVLVGPSNAWFADTSFTARVIALGPWVVAAAGAAALLHEVVRRRWIPPRVIVIAAIAVLVANMWTTTFSANAESTFDPVSGSQMPSFWQQLEGGDIPQQIAASDDAAFFKVYQRMRGGQPYYPAFSAELEANPRWTSRSVASFREPAIFWFWSVLPSARFVVVAFLVLASAAIVCVVPIAAGVVKMPLVLPACAALASYFVYFPVQLPLFSQESWAAFFAVGSLAAFSMSVRSERWQAWVVVSVIMAVLGTLVRETLVFVPVAGMASAFVGEERRSFRVVAWSLGLVALVAAYALHYVATRPYLAGEASQSQFATGGLENVAAAITYATDMLGAGGILVFGLVALGVIGAILLPDRAMRLFALLCTVAPLVAFLFVANRAWYETTGQRINYWGASVIPLAYALIPVAFSILPGALTKSAATRTASSTKKRPARSTETATVRSR